MTIGWFGFKSNLRGDGRIGVIRHRQLEVEGQFGSGLYQLGRKGLFKFFCFPQIKEFEVHP